MSETGGNASPSFVDILEEMNQEGGFTRSVLASSEGLPIASVPVNPDSELASALVALLQKVSADTQDQLGLSPVDEITIRLENQEHLVCRTITTGRDCLSLCALVPPHHPYRRATNRAVKRIREILNS
jgi:predicted regulator of Ras-like GTPase activity (Roadblock/LC7/MglB family)